MFKKGNIPWIKGRKIDINKYPNYGMRGKNHSEESKKKMSISHIGKKKSAITKKRMSEVKKGKIPNNWKGIKKNKGYWYIYKPKHPRAIKKYVKQANLVMEKKIGRLLTKEEIVHHIGEKDDDRIKMLYLMRGRSQHENYESNLRWTYRKWSLGTKPVKNE